ncbi:HPF/RaiA family ribosome-associated protein [Candidatus Saccharibacteria bacterium]|jgi:ribosomal subunit interface protein|nr:HPF/RaiA family ribosome-associated protein [Candidatus Saccharibacteria bacterium]
MIDHIDILGEKDYKVGERLEKYASKRIGKLDRYLPRGYRRNLSGKVSVAQINHTHNNKYEITASINIPGGKGAKTLTAKTEASNVFSGIDILEAKLMRQARRFKTEKANQRAKGLFQRFRKKQK